jgi:hypothetical protein
VKCREAAADIIIPTLLEPSLVPTIVLEAILGLVS